MLIFNQKDVLTFALPVQLCASCHVRIERIQLKDWLLFMRLGVRY